MNLRGGLYRAALAFGLPWIAFWSWTFWDATQEEVDWNRQATTSAQRQQGLTGDELLFMNDMVRAARSFEQDARERKEFAIKVGALAPLVLTVLLTLCFWVRRGFLKTSR